MVQVIPENQEASASKGPKLSAKLSMEQPSSEEVDKEDEKNDSFARLKLSTHALT